MNADQSTRIDKLSLTVNLLEPEARPQSSKIIVIESAVDAWFEDKEYPEDQLEKILIKLEVFLEETKKVKTRLLYTDWVKLQCVLVHIDRNRSFNIDGILNINKIFKYNLEIV